MKIPWSIPNIQQEEKDALQRVIDSEWYSMGKEVEKFEEKTASYLNRNRVIILWHTTCDSTEVK